MTERVEIVNGDSLLVLQLMDDNSVDAIVTDPPYGLAFMGKKWDYDVPSEELWRQCFRVLKAGGHLLCFAGTRTQHRMAVRIEDAGFEIRDMIAWVYGCLSEDTEILTKNGWEQYRISKNNSIFADKEILIYDPENDIYKWEKPKRWSEYNIHKDTAYRIKSNTTDQIVSRNHRCLVEREGKLIFVKAEELDKMEFVPTLQGDIFSKVEGKGSFLQSSMQWSGKGSGMEKTSSQGEGQLETRERTGFKGKNDWKQKLGMERWSNLFQKKREICRPIYKICEVSKFIFEYGKKRWLCNGTQIESSARNTKAPNKVGMRTPYQSRCNGQQNREFDAIQDERRTQEIRERKSYNTTLATVEPFEYSGIIFCPTVSTSAFVARRNGKIFITGNSGFPKSLDVSKAIDKMDAAEEQQARRYRFTEWVRSTGITSKQIDEATGTNMGGHYTTAASQPAIMTREHLEACRHLLGEVPAWVEQEADIRSVESKNFAEREVVGKHKTDMGGLGGERLGQAGGNITAPATDAAKQWQGWGTALKPALEPITVARKPLIGTVAENVLTWGTGGVNVEASRVGYVNELDKASAGFHGRSAIAAEKSNFGQLRTGFAKSEQSNHRLGRWPANFIHDGSEEATDLLKDSARFFYCAKASKADRDAGCEGLEKKNAGECTDRIEGSAGMNSPRAGAGRTNGSHNHHPTVKPTDLMRYLCRLVTPPDGTVLDPFMGSGSTGKAAVLEGFRFIGIEREQEYCEIAKARIKHIQL